MSKKAMCAAVGGLVLAAGCAGPMFEGSIFEQPPRKAAEVARVPDGNSMQLTGTDATRLSEQIEAVTRSQEVLSGRLDRLEAQMASSARSPDDLVAMRRDIQIVRAERETLKKEITDDLAARIEKVAARQQAEVRSARPSAAATVAPAASRPAGKTAVRSGYEHKVEKGQTLSVIAKGYGKSVDSIMKANKITNPSSIRVGQVLFIPD